RADGLSMDSVLCDAASRHQFIERGRPDWRASFDACGDDALSGQVARLVELLDDELVVVLLTGRPLRVQPQTLAWLERYRLRWDLLILRDVGDYAAAREFKHDTAYDLRQYGFDLRLAFEDDRRNLEMFR